MTFGGLPRIPTKPVDCETKDPFRGAPFGRNAIRRADPSRRPSQAILFNSTK